MLRQKIRIQTTDDRGFEVQEEKGQINRLQIKHFRIPHSLSAPIHNYGNILTAIFFFSRALSVEWIRLFVSFIGQDLQD
jgi:hypothetical protein